MAEHTAQIVPTVLATKPADYEAGLSRAQGVSRRVHIDVADGGFAPNTTINLAQVYWDNGVEADLHLMVNEPGLHTETCISLNPYLVIIHAEAREYGRVSKLEMMKQLQAVGIKAGVALLADTTVNEAQELIVRADHVLLFAGKLGFYGGEMDRGVLAKAGQLRAIKHDIEIGIDGGVNDGNAAIVLAAGIDVLNVGGFIQNASDPKKAYAKLKQIVNRVGDDSTGA